VVLSIKDEKSSVVGTEGDGDEVEQRSLLSSVSSSSSISWAQHVGGGDDDDDDDVCCNEGMSVSVETSLVFERLESSLGEVGGSTSRSFANLLFLLGVGGVIGVGD